MRALGPQLFPGLEDSTVLPLEFHGISANHQPFGTGLDGRMSSALATPRTHIIFHSLVVKQGD